MRKSFGREHASGNEKARETHHDARQAQGPASTLETKLLQQLVTDVKHDRASLPAILLR